MQAYQYQPLPSSSCIRVLILHPAAEVSSALECDIITKDRLSILRDPHNKTFDAVSYVWGTGAHDIPLYCRSERTYLYISAVVDGMLRCLRKGHKGRRLWVDAICLNQKDNHEKSIQVQQMGQIYHIAEKVHVWLGPAVATTPLVFAFLRTLVAKFEPTPGQAKSPTTEEILYTFEETFQHRNFQPVLGLIQKPWFTRRWTLQEGFLARDAIVRCGGSKIPWHWFAEGLELIRGRSHELQSIKNDQSSLYALEVLKTLQNPTDLLSLLWTLHMSECSDPRDRIYSLLGLAQKTDQEAPIPNYGLSVDAVYRAFAGQCISTGSFLQILLHIDALGRLSEVDPTWPSWVPNWTRARERKLHSPMAMSRIMPPFIYLPKGFFYHGRRRETQDYVYSYKFLSTQPTEFTNGSRHGLFIYGKSIQKTLKICDTWPEKDDSNHLIRYLTCWFHQEAILNMPDQELIAAMMEREVMERLLFLITGSYFFGYAMHNLLQGNRDFGTCSEWVQAADVRDSNDSPCINRCRRIANILYPIVKYPTLYTLEQVHLMEHLDERYNDNSLPTSEGQKELSDFLDDVSRMMREGKKQLIVALCDDNSAKPQRSHWIAPNDVRMGDLVTDVTSCGRIGALLRPIDSPSEVNGRPAFQLIGILWSLDRGRKALNEIKDFLIL